MINIVDSSKILNPTVKDSCFIAQYHRLFLYYKENKASRYMASVETGIPIQNICRYVGMMFDRGVIAVIRKDKCHISGEIVEFLSTNPELFPKDNQLKLWVE
jgi:hypothetical protein